MRGLKHLRHPVHVELTRRTLMGAWIETKRFPWLAERSLVAPLWVRGLKRPGSAQGRPVHDVAPLWVRGLKQKIPIHTSVPHRVAPLWVRGLKQKGLSGPRGKV